MRAFCFALVSLLLWGQSSMAVGTNTPREVAFAFTRADSKPLGAGHLIFLFEAKGQKEADALRTDKNGVARVAKLALGRYDLWIEPRADVPGKRFRGLEVQAGAGAQKFELAIPESTAVRGRLVSPDGTPAALCRVAVQSGTWLSMRKADRPGYARGSQDAYAETFSEKDGSFVLTGLAPGEYRLDVFKLYARAPHATIPFAITKAGQTMDIGTWRLPQNGWEWLFDGHLRRAGALSKYFGSGAMTIENERLILGSGNALTGVTWTENLPLVDYEISLDALRADGKDFFCGLTFPVGKSPLSFIVGGWGGTIVGISSVDWLSAEENETTKVQEFETGRWYRIRLRVTNFKVEAWIDDQKMVDLLTKGRALSIRPTVEESLPLGIATYHTTAWLRDIRLRRLDASEIEAIGAVAVKEQALRE